MLDSYSRRDADKAVSVWRDDANIDAAYVSLFRELLTYMMEDPRSITLCTHLLFAAKNLERIGDHATNVAETVHYLVHGQLLLDERPGNRRPEPKARRPGLNAQAPAKGARGGQRSPRPRGGLQRDGYDLRAPPLLASFAHGLIRDSGVPFAVGQTG